MSTEETIPEQASFADQVKTVLEQVTQDENGKTVWPEADEAVLYAARAEKRYRDTQSSYTKGQQQLKTVQEERDQLAQKYTSVAMAQLTAAEQTKLEELKFKDPEAWREEMNKLETEAKNKLSQEMLDIGEQASKKGELEIRSELLKQFREDNPGVKLDDETIANDIPPRITAKLEKGEVSFAQFLSECADYLNKPKKIAGSDEELESDPDLGSLPGGGEPTKEAKVGDLSETYEKTIF